MSQVNVRFYGRLAETLGAELYTPIPSAGMSLRELRILLARQPKGAILLDAGVKVAVGDEIVTDDRIVRPGDQLDFLAPVSGG